MDVSEIERLIAVLSKSDITNFELEGDGWRLSLARSAEVSTGGAVVSKVVSDANGQAAVAASEPEETGVKVESPIVGTFYRKPSPDADSFVSEGDRVKKGQTLCIVEAMKLMNEIAAPCDGVVTRIMLSDAQVVEFGEVIMVIDPS